MNNIYEGHNNLVYAQKIEYINHFKIYTRD